MIGIHALTRSGKAGVYFALAILAFAIDLLLSVITGLVLPMAQWEGLLVFALPSVVIVAALAHWIHLPESQSRSG